MGKTPDGAALRLSDVSKTFGTVAAVRGVSESFASGEYFCILGPSGCGKTTLLRIVAGFDVPSHGEVILGDRAITRVPPERRDVNMVFQSYALFPHMTVADNVSFGLRMRGTAREETGRRVKETLALVDLAPVAGRYPRELSGGQQQRVALARALINRPRVLLLDEPLSALDRNLRLAMQDELRRIQREVGITFLHVTHDQSEALSMSDRVAVMQDGRFVQVGAPREVYRAPANRFVAEFLGSSNILAVTVDRSRPGWVAHRGGWSLRVDGAADGGTGAVSALIRPECIELSTRHPAGRDNVFEGTVLAVTHLGPLVECRVRAGGVELDVHVLSRQLDAGVAVGALVYLAIAPADVFLLPAP